MFPTELPRRTVPDVSETSPGLRWRTVGEGGGGFALCEGPLRAKSSDQSASALQCWLVFVPRRAPGAPFYLLSHVFCPLKASANYTICNLCPAAAL